MVKEVTRPPRPRLDAAGLRSRPVLQVHDEVILEVRPEEETEVERRTFDAMQRAAGIDVAP